MNDFYTYLHCKPNGEPFYVGKGKNNRVNDFHRGRSNWHKGIVKKYGKENILKFIFFCDSEDQAFKDEIQQIAQLRKEGYELCNLTNGGDGTSGFFPSEETRKKLSEARKGRVFSDETKEKIRQSNIGQIRSEEIRKKMSIAKTGTKRSPDVCLKISQAMTGRKVTDEFRKKMSDIRNRTVALKRKQGAI